MATDVSPPIAAIIAVRLASLVIYSGTKCDMYVFFNISFDNGNETKTVIVPLLDAGGQLC